jgi:hypothetical protein
MTDLVLYQVFNVACILKVTLKYLSEQGFCAEPEDDSVSGVN